MRAGWRNRLAVVVPLAALGGLAAEPGWAQDNDLYLTMTGIPAGTVAPGGVAFISGGWTSDRVNSPGGSSFTDDTDGSLSFGAGFGNAEDAVGFQVTANLSSLSDDFGDSGYFEVKAARRVSVPGQVPVYVAIIGSNLAPWGDSGDNEESIDLVMSAFPSVTMGGGTKPLMVTFGFGSHARDFGTKPGAYFGLGLGLTRNVAVSAAFNGDEVSLGTGFRLDGLPNMHFTASLDDAFDQNDSRRVTLQATFVTDFLSGGGF